VKRGQRYWVIQVLLVGLLCLHRKEYKGTNERESERLKKKIDNFGRTSKARMQMVYLSHSSYYGSLATFLTCWE
jgi:hypothetical protein